ncbi:hypothetical protein [Streptomyces lunaelactis]|uniref:hypothetical protein n=1 Tax=Streptomyces lunaelactis TaxID=1535768 RepID=UPI0015854FB0|nr:hypothetical protein [Streptomyces lunaelactis]NUL09059.1 hypothetical protein [Streptomyces lunaelactis]
MKIFGREPALLLGFAAAFLQLLAAFGLDVNATQQTLINTVLACVVAVVSAIVLKAGALGATLMQLAAAGMALFVGFGLDWPADTQGKVMAALAAALALWTRTQVVAPVTSIRLEQSSPIKPAAPQGV